MIAIEGNRDQDVVRKQVLDQICGTSSLDPTPSIHLTTVSSLSTVGDPCFISVPLSNASSSWLRAASGLVALASTSRLSVEEEKLSESVDREEQVRKASLDRILSQALDEDFEDGIESQLDASLRSFVIQGGLPAIRPLQNLTEMRWLNSAVIGEALRVLGRLRHDETHRQRFGILVKGLEHPSAVVRDAAGLALSELGDRAAVAHLEAAIKRESNAELRSDLEAVLLELRT